MSFNLSKQIATFEGQKEELMKMLAENAKNHFIDNFHQKSWEGSAWQPRKFNKYDDGHPLLEKTGSLKNAIENPNIEVNENSYKLTIENDYAEYQNDGTNTIPSRKWMGDSEKLEEEQKKIIEGYINRIFNV